MSATTKQSNDERLRPINPEATKACMHMLALCFRVTGVELAEAVAFADSELEPLIERWLDAADIVHGETPSKALDRRFLRTALGSMLDRLEEAL